MLSPLLSRPVESAILPQGDIRFARRRLRLTPEH